MGTRRWIDIRSGTSGCLVSGSCSRIPCWGSGRIRGWIRDRTLCRSVVRAGNTVQNQMLEERERKRERALNIFKVNHIFVNPENPYIV